MAGSRSLRRTRIAAAALLLAVASCRAPSPSGSTPAATAAPVPAATPTRVVLKLYSGSSTGLVVGEAAAGGSPGAELPDQSFVENPGLAKTYIWSFQANSTMLDRSCRTITRTAAINIANSPGANAAVFVQTKVAGGLPAPVRVQILPAHADAAGCV